MKSFTSVVVVVAFTTSGGCMSKGVPQPTAPNHAGAAAHQATPSEASAAVDRPPQDAAASGFWKHSAKTIDGASRALSDFKGKALLIVNTASRCGYTSQYKDLQTIYSEYKARGFEVLAFPSNDFGGQEPGSDAEIKNFCASRFQTTFPLFGKVKVKGAQKAPLYRFLTERASESVRGEVRWNFTKFLVSPRGDVVARFEPGDVPTDRKMRAAIEKVLPKRAM